MRFVLKYLQTTALAAALAAFPVLMAQTSSDPTRGSSNPAMSGSGTTQNNGSNNGGNTGNRSGTNPDTNTGSSDPNSNATSQAPSGASGSTPSPSYGDRSYDRNNSHNFGWIGLLGLAGLTGLFRRNHGNDFRTNRDDARVNPRV